MLEYKYANLSHVYSIYPSFYLVKKDFDLGNKKVIDLGASDGRYLKHFGPDSCGVEYNEPDRNLAKKNGLRVEFGNLNNDFDFYKDESFDFVFSSHVIEHLDSPYLFLKRIRNFGGESCKLILGYPIECSLVRLFDPYFGHDGHMYAFSLQNMRKLLNETGFKIEKIYYDIPFAGRFKIMSQFQVIAQFLPYWLVGWWINALYIVAKKQN